MNASTPTKPTSRTGAAGDNNQPIVSGLTVQKLIDTWLRSSEPPEPLSDTLGCPTSIKQQRIAKAYHLTPVRNLKYILVEGLLARKGRRSRSAGESANGVWLFPSIDDLVYGIDHWIPNMFSKHTRLALIEVEVANEALDGEHIEVRCPFDIRRSQLRIVSRDVRAIPLEQLARTLGYHEHSCEGRSLEPQHLLETGPTS